MGLLVLKEILYRLNKKLQLEAVTDFNPVCRVHRVIQITILQPGGVTCMQISKGRQK